MISWPQHKGPGNGSWPVGGAGPHTLAKRRLRGSGAPGASALPGPSHPIAQPVIRLECRTRKVLGKATGPTEGPSPPACLPLASPVEVFSQHEVPGRLGGGCGPQ